MGMDWMRSTPVRGDGDGVRGGDARGDGARPREHPGLSVLVLFARCVNVC
jgi:hypothetical protein